MSAVELLIPHTLKVTTWGERKAGDTVNIEVDQMARCAARLIERPGRAGVTFGNRADVIVLSSVGVGSGRRV